MVSQVRDHDEISAARRHLVVRVAVVAGLIVALLAGLLIYEREQETGSAPEAKPQGMAVAPIGNAVSSSPAAALSEEISKAIAEAPDTTQEVLASLSAPVVVPEETFDPTVPREGESAPEPAKTVTRTASAPPPIRANDRLVVEQTKPTPAAIAKPAASAAPVLVPPAPPAVAAPVSAALPSTAGYLIQLGIFNNRGNAEELRSKLALAGIPSQLETRVHLGPFKTREDALKAQQTLRTLGMTQGLLVPPKKPQ
ncbi:MAG: SPOR domain-containing protein [Uliginosibacterium sp.]|nr:SPOR domain-containing protein [Uliginosibacterium sp.]